MARRGYRAAGIPSRRARKTGRPSFAAEGFATTAGRFSAKAAAAAVLAFGLVGCNLADPPPFDPRYLQQSERTHVKDAQPSYMRPLPTTRTSPFADAEAANMRYGGAATTNGSGGLGAPPPTTLPTTGPSIGLDEPVVRLSLQEVVHRAVANNHDVRVAGYQPAIEGTRVTEADARFDPVFFQNLTFSHQDVLNAGSFSTNFIDNGSAAPSFRTGPFYTRDQQDQYQSQTGIKQNLRSGGQIQLQYEANYTWYSPQRFFLNPFYENNLTLKLTQPLLRDFGNNVNEARIVINRDTQKISLLDFRKQLETTTADIEKFYWQLVQAERDVQIQNDLLATNESTYKILSNRMQQRLDVSILQVSQAQTSLEQRRGQLIQAKQHVRDLSDQIKQLMSDPEFPVASNIVVLPADVPVQEPLHFNLKDQIDTAMENRFELGQQQLRVDAATVTVMVAKNNLLPQLNFVGSTGVQGLGGNEGNALARQSDFNHISYSAGLQLEIPIGNREARAIWKRTLLQRMQAIEQYSSLVNQVALDVSTSARAVYSAWDLVVTARRARYSADAALRAVNDRERANEPLTPEFVQLKLQLADSLDVALSNENQAISQYNIAISQLERAKGTLLRYNNVLMQEQSPTLQDNGLLR